MVTDIKPRLSRIGTGPDVGCRVVLKIVVARVTEGSNSTPTAQVNSP
ncbi:hypothetical protein ABT030_22310 [Streptomyces mirabilis]